MKKSKTPTAGASSAQRSGSVWIVDRVRTDGPPMTSTLERWMNNEGWEVVAIVQGLNAPYYETYLRKPNVPLERLREKETG